MDKKLNPLGLVARNLFCIGRNYAAHAKELNNPVPVGKPVVFLKPTSAICYSGERIVLPPESDDVHHEVELVLAIGRAGRHIAESAAWDYLAGCAVGIDVTARDLQEEAKQTRLPWAVAKGFDTFAPLSEFVPLPEAGRGPYRIRLTVNGQLRQEGTTDAMLFSIPRLVAYLSSIFTLSPGDLIFTGTPPGVGSLREGDAVVAELDEARARLAVTVAR